MKKKVEEKKAVIIQTKTYSFYSLFGHNTSLDEMIKSLADIKQEFLEYRILHNCEIQLSHSGSTFEVTAKRIETDNEFFSRIEKKNALAAKRAAEREATKIEKQKEEIELLMKLKKKYAKLESV